MEKFRHLLAKIKTPEWRGGLRRFGDQALIVAFVIAGLVSLDVTSRVSGDQSLFESVLPHGYLYLAAPDSSNPRCVNVSILASHPTRRGEAVSMYIDSFVGDAVTYEVELDLSGKPIVFSFGHEVCFEDTKNAGLIFWAQNGTVREKGNMYRFDK